MTLQNVKDKLTLENLKWLLILGLVFYIMFLKSCRKCEPSVQTITHTDTIPGDTVMKEIRMKFPVPVIQVEHDTAWKYHKVDTLAILKDYYTKYHTLDSIHGPDIKGTLEEVIYKNSIAKRRLELQNTRVTTINNTIVNNWENSIYIGFSGYFGQQQGLGLSGQYVTKNWSLGGGYDFVNRQVRGDFELNLRYIFSRK